MEYFEKEIFNKDTDVDILRELEHVVNVMPFNSKEHYDQLDTFEQLGIFALAVYVVNYIGTNIECCSTDPRNEYSYKVASEVQGLSEFQKVFDRWEQQLQFTDLILTNGKGSTWDQYDFGLSKLAEEFTYMLHRTNQQTALGYMLYVLGEQVPELKQEMQELYGETGYYRFACI